MNGILIIFVLLSMSFVKASDENANFDDQKLRQMLNDETLEMDVSSPVIDQDSLDVTSSDQKTDSIDHDRFRILERQIQNLENQMEELKRQLKDKTSKFSLESKREEINNKDSSEISVFDSRPALKIYEQAQNFLEKQDYRDAEKALNDIIDSYPEDPLIINSKYWLGETYFLQKKYKKAAQYFANAYEIYQKMTKKEEVKNQKIFKMSFAKAPEALVKLAHCLKLLEKKKQACLTLAQLQNEFPHTTQTIRKSSEKLKEDLQCADKIVDSN